MIFVFVINILIINFVNAVIPARDYCAIPCGPKTVGLHTMCKYPEGPANSCEEYKKYKYSSENIHDLLIEHNAIRQDFRRFSNGEGKIFYTYSYNQLIYSYYLFL